MAIGGIQNTFDIQQYVSQIMEYEKRPLFALQDRKTNMEGQISAWDRINASIKKLQTTLNTLQQASTFQSMLATSSDSSCITATADVNSAETTYTFSDITLAKSASTTSTSALGLLSGTAASITSSEEINTTEEEDANPNQTISSGLMNLDADKSIVAGSFYVNNKEITVTEDDTIYTILSKINSSDANVTATFENDTISITQKDAGISYSVRLTNDTTGFFDAMKLPNGQENVAYGVDHDYNRDIIDSAISGSVVDGYFNINGITFTVDVDSDSFSDIVNRINSSEAGVLAYYDSVDDKITLTSIVDGQDVTLSNDTASIFSSLNISVQSYTGTDSTFTLNGQTMTRSSNTFELNGTTFTLRSSLDAGDTVSITVEKDVQKIEDAIQGFVDQYNETTGLIKEETGEDETGIDKPLKGNRQLNSIKRRLRAMVTSTISTDDESNLNHLSEVGVALDHSSTDKILSLDTTKLAAAIANDVDDVFKLFAINTDNYSRDDDGGFSGDMYNYINNYTKRFSGFIVTHNDFIRSSIERIERRIERVEAQMDRKEQQLIEEYQNLQNAVSKLDNQSYSAVSFINQFSSSL